jgi:hypothetical protein
MTFTARSGIVTPVTSGSKPEYGAGGFELYATETGIYILNVETYRFEIPMDGQYTRLTFRLGTPPQPSGVIDGTLVDHLDQPVSNRLIYLNSDTVQLTGVTDEQGYFRFENLPDDVYTVTVEDSTLSETVTLSGSSQVTLSLKLPAPPPSGGHWEMTIERGEGLPLLVGDIGVANEPIIITNPDGFQTIVTSGSKPEWGLGGFELYAPETGDYVIQFLGQTFTVPMAGQFTKTTFRYVEAPTEDNVLLVSEPLPRAEAESIHEGLEAHPATQGKFSIVDPEIVKP